MEKGNFGFFLFLLSKDGRLSFCLKMSAKYMGVPLDYFFKGGVLMSFLSVFYWLNFLFSGWF
ncbi:hypothetical protein PU02_0261 [Bartonella ancashensis]|uniref:Uncharacterized protein n=1 Tax=Bartonella ancashensis TaxID=1318743 RepID=A0A0M3T2P1_9HYPH|nr:hypothetical protein PU02_0261 [Bartonella ancashensis]